MRKDREQQKKERVKQLDLFKDHDKPAEQPEGRTGGKALTGAELSSQLERQRTLTTNVLEAIAGYSNLTKAYRQVRQNGGIKFAINGLKVDSIGNKEKIK